MEILSFRVENGCLWIRKRIQETLFQSSLKWLLIQGSKKTIRGNIKTVQAQVRIQIVTRILTRTRIPVVQKRRE
jgi:hypothetical protein